MIIQLAKTVQQNPAMYPQIRQMAIQRGILPAEEIPEQYDEGLITAIIMAAKAMEADVQIESADAPMAPVPQTPAQPPAQMAVGANIWQCSRRTSLPHTHTDGVPLVYMIFCVGPTFTEKTGDILKNFCCIY